MKTIGIIGGMGPLATVDLFAKIVRRTQAQTDQEHIPILIDNNTRIPDRTAAILEGGEDPVPELVRSALRLEAMGADALIMACNTAHYFVEEIRRFARIPLLSMIEEAAKEAKARGLQCVGLLATEGTCRTGIYDRAFEAQGVRVCKPPDELEAHVMDLIYKGVKAGAATYPLEGIRATVAELQARGAECFVLGCTELPLAVEMYRLAIPVIDPTEVLARCAIRFAGKELIPEGEAARS